MKAAKIMHPKFQFKAFWSAIAIITAVLIFEAIYFAVMVWETGNRLTYAEPILHQQKLVAQANMKIEGLQTLIDKKKPTYTQKEIEDYIRVIFGKDADVAIAVSRHECSPKNPQYPGCIASSPVEYSVGIFQINLKNATHFIHAQKVPGKTMEEKIENLKDPFINTLIAKSIYSDQNGFGAWSAYTNHSYLQALALIQKGSEK